MFQVVGVCLCFCWKCSFHLLTIPLSSVNIFPILLKSFQLFFQTNFLYFWVWFNRIVLRFSSPFLPRLKFRKFEGRRWYYYRNLPQVFCHMSRTISTTSSFWTNQNSITSQNDIVRFSKTGVIPRGKYAAANGAFPKVSSRRGFLVLDNHLRHHLRL